MSNRKYKHDTRFSGYGTYSKVKPAEIIEYVELPTVEDQRQAEIADLRAKAAAAKSEYNRKLYTREADLLEAGR